MMNDIFNETSTTNTYETPSGPTTPNIDHYRKELAEFDLTDEEQQALLQIMWEITYQFALMGFGMESTQLVMEHLIKNIASESDEEVQQKSTNCIMNAEQKKESSDEK